MVLLQHQLKNYKKAQKIYLEKCTSLIFFFIYFCIVILQAKDLDIFTEFHHPYFLVNLKNEGKQDWVVIT